MKLGSLWAFVAFGDAADGQDLASRWRCWQRFTYHLPASGRAVKRHVYQCAWLSWQHIAKISLHGVWWHPLLKKLL